ncbi:carboxylesterase [Meridianimarinicoccus sp. MJW13]|uniref:alpha/beta hydrolase n=1 Tax=Meridianimarinicoccus sp. MJW13 TaxID=2720031 RepID=UPI001D0124A7|nr:alpha/beta fold hydrolase [Fluviibacterium sp. MJW13]
MMGMILTLVKWAVGLAILAWGTLALLDWIGPTEPADLATEFDPAQLGADLDVWLAEQEAQVANLRDNAAKEIVWAGEPGGQTPLSVVYIHGFSATKAELRPLPDMVAASLGANLYLTRLPGHGRDSAAMGEPEVNDWMTDVAEALAIGASLGERVIVMGNSTGATLAVAAAADPALNAQMAGLVLMSPNFGAAGLKGRAIEWPLINSWGRLVIGDTYSFEPRNAGHAENWTTSYPFEAVARLGALSHKVRNMDLGAMTVPAIFFVSNEDQVIDPKLARRASADWGAPSELVPVVRVEGDDPSGHVLAGDILSPNKTAPIAERIVAWARGL